VIDWEPVPVTEVPVHLLVWPCHHIDPAHLHADVGTRTGPIHCEELLDGSLFIHDGRHRTIRAMRQGRVTIEAKVIWKCSVNGTPSGEGPGARTSA
jgi:hypothetical protein